MGRNFLGLCGYSMSKMAAEKCLSQAGMTIRDVDIIEVHDCFSPNEARLEILILILSGFKGHKLDGLTITYNIIIIVIIIIIIIIIIVIVIVIVIVIIIIIIVIIIIGIFFFYILKVQ